MPNELSGLQQVEFETVAIDRQGVIVERSIQRARQAVEDLGNGVILEMVAIQDGMFRMGSRESQGYADEHPQHSVRVSVFLMAKYPVTQEQWAAVMDWTPPYRCRGAKRPVDRVSWSDSWEFCRRLSARTRRAYRLPSEAWHEDYDGAPTDGRAWESRGTVHRVLRGGCWHDPPGLCRSAARLKQAPDQGEDFFGFRVALGSLETGSDVAVEPPRMGSIGRIPQQIRRWARR
jgi:formylglycine-generating enzyme required for sulfatase activity